MAKLSSKDAMRFHLAITYVHAFHDGYIFCERMRRAGQGTPHLHRFFGTALTTYLHAFYDDRKQGLLSLLRLLNLGDYVRDIETCLDAPVGPTTYYEIFLEARNRAVAHPQYTRKSLKKVIEHKEILDDPAATKAMTAADRKLRKLTAGLYVVFRRYWPDHVADADKEPEYPEDK